MNEKNNLDYISVNSVLSDLDEKLSTMKRKVKHGRLKIQRKKIKSQVMKKHNPTDIKRDKICRDARKKAHSVTANARRHISNDVREGLTLVNPNALTLSEAYDLDFLEEAVGYDIEVNFFDKPEVTPITEGLSVGTTKTGRKKKCKAIGVAEGCFAPISTPAGDRVFSRNHRLYEEDHWECQFENQNLLDRVNTRRMLGTIGHYDKKVDDKDLAKGDVSHIVTALEIREDEKHGRYLWGRLEIINTPAGKLLKEYYDNDIPLFVSSRGGGKLIDVPGKDYKIVDKHRYYCETFDVVKEPGFLEACPEYHSESNNTNDAMEEAFKDVENLLREIADKNGFVIDETNLEALKNTLCESRDAELDEDNNMPKVNVDVTAQDTMEEVVKKVIQPMQDETQTIVKSLAESIAKLTDVVNQVRSDIYEGDEAPAEETAQEVSEEESAEQDAEVAEPKEEVPAEEPKAEEAVEESTETPVEEGKKEEDDKKEECKCGKCDKCKGKKEEEKADECSESEEPAEEPKAEEEPAKEEAPAEEPVAEATEEPTPAEEPKAEEPKEEPAEKVEEQWAHVDPKETVGDKAEHKAPQKDPGEPLKGDVYANEPAPAVAGMKRGEDAPQTTDPTHKEEKPAVNGAILEEEATEEPAGEVTAEEEQQVVDYQAAYEEMKSEVEDATRLIDETTQMFEDFGKRHREVVAEAKEIKESLEERISSLELELNSIKISEKFDVTIETAKEMLSSKSYEAVEEELTESEAKQVEDEAQAKADEVSESIKEETINAKAPVSRQVYSAFATSESQTTNEKSGRQTFSWFN